MENKNILVLETSEGDKHRINIDIKHMSGLIDKICQDYQGQEIKLEISKDELNSVIEFFEIIGYKPLGIKRPMIDLGRIYERFIKPNERLAQFYIKLNSDGIIKYFKIADYMDLTELENVLYLKLLLAFDNSSKMNELFGNISPESLNLSQEMEIQLKKKYLQYCKVYTESLTNEQLNYLMEELKNS
jgi:hypothetical protein